MEPNYSPPRALTLVLLGLGIFYLVATLTSLYYWLNFDAWRPYLGQIAGIALVISVPTAYLAWKYHEKRHKP